jgi:hypothetical protein
MKNYRDTAATVRDSQISDFLIGFDLISKM